MSVVVASSIAIAKKQKCVSSFLLFISSPFVKIAFIDVSDSKKCSNLFYPSIPSRRSNTPSHPDHSPLFSCPLLRTVKPISVNITSKKDPISAGRKTEVTCRTSGSRPPAQITWYKNKKLMTHSRLVVSVKLSRLQFCSIVAWLKFHLDFFNSILFDCCRLSFVCCNLSNLSMWIMHHVEKEENFIDFSYSARINLCVSDSDRGKRDHFSLCIRLPHNRTKGIWTTGTKRCSLSQKTVERDGRAFASSRCALYTTVTV